MLQSVRGVHTSVMTVPGERPRAVRAAAATTAALHGVVRAGPNRAYRVPVVCMERITPNIRCNGAIRA